MKYSTTDMRRLKAVKQVKAREAYKSNPNNCLHCLSTLVLHEQIRLSDIKAKKFCNRSCAASYNNSKIPKREKKFKPSKEERKSKYLAKTKKQHFNDCKDYHSARCSITKLSRTVFRLSGKDYSCEQCGYNKHVEISHKKAVADFSDSSLLSEICAINNLQTLCPNHHWEYDNIQTTVTTK